MTMPVDGTGPGDAEHGKILICHWANDHWIGITIDTNGLNGHAHHDLDIWPPVEGVTPGHNWPAGEGVYIHGCGAGEPTPTASGSPTLSVSAPPPTATVTATTTVIPTMTPTVTATTTVIPTITATATVTVPPTALPTATCTPSIPPTSAGTTGTMEPTALIVVLALLAAGMWLIWISLKVP